MSPSAAVESRGRVRNSLSLPSPQLLGAACLALGIFVYIKKDDFGGVLATVPLGDDTTKDALDNPSLLETAAIGETGRVRAVLLVFISGPRFCRFEGWIPR